MLVDGASEITQSVLANGLPLVEIPLAGRLATRITIAFPAGALHEQPGKVGVAHLLEHMAFKGTEKYRTARDLYRASEPLGTELDGATSYDSVEVGATVQAEFAMATIELLSDICANALLEEEHLEAERKVILQEIADEDESPACRAEDLLSAAMFPEHRLGVDVAGRAADVCALSYGQVLQFRERQWSPEGGVVVIAGNLEHLDRKHLEELLLGIPARGKPASPPALPSFARRIEVEEHDSDVVHLRLGYSVPGLHFASNHDQAIAHVYGNLLGGTMGSRLHEELREQRSLCYWVDGLLWGDREAAFLSVDCSIRSSNLDEVYERIDAVIATLAESGPTDEEVARARSYSVGATARYLDTVGGRAEHAVELIMEYRNHDVAPLAYLAMLENVSHTDIARVAASVEPGPCVGCVGPVTKADFE